MKEPDPPSDPAKDEGAAQVPQDDARSLLERELYWAGDPNTPTSQSTKQLRIALHDFAARMRADERSRVPRQEPLLGSASRWKRNVKVSVFSTLRPVTHRYDRLLAELATMSRMLAERLAEAEAQIEVLRREVQELRSSQEPGR
jgi:hypothetical protein